ncbi:MAG: hypothetical protein KME26_18710 [Oscillatoria princeps RMCB-10]|nr:hypothetical protein [Oscillatoria princeps RMCB-10]
MVIIRYEDESGREIVPRNLEKDIALSYIGSALFSPVTAVTIVVGSGVRDIRTVIEEVKTQMHHIHSDGYLKRMRYVYQTFGAEIDKLVNSNYPEEVKSSAKEELLLKMKQLSKDA